jgi:hypothetical protein
MSFEKYLYVVSGLPMEKETEEENKTPNCLLFTKRVSLKPDVLQPKR